MMRNNLGGWKIIKNLRVRLGLRFQKVQFKITILKCAI
jgi:hypothetical protein